jgi:hypothetical protein
MPNPVKPAGRPPKPPPPQQRDIALVCPCLREKFYRLRDELDETEGITLSTIETLRHPLRQEYYLKIGASRTWNSRHLANKKGKSEAIDVCPVPLLAVKNWGPTSPMWQKLGEAVRAVGLTWGGDWKSFVDMAHMELKNGCECED